MTKIRVKWDPERPAKLLRAGEQQSEIQWLDTKTTGHLLNSDFEVIQEKPK
jgi:hypothetical protein